MLGVDVGLRDFVAQRPHVDGKQIRTEVQGKSRGLMTVSVVGVMRSSRTSTTGRAWRGFGDQVRRAGHIANDSRAKKRGPLPAGKSRMFISSRR